MSMLGIKRQQERMRFEGSTRFSFMREDSEQDNGHFSVMDRRKSGFTSVIKVHKVNGKKWRKR